MYQILLICHVAVLIISLNENIWSLVVEYDTSTEFSRKSQFFACGNFSPKFHSISSFCFINNSSIK